MAFLAAERLTENSETRSLRFHVMLDHDEWKITYGHRVIGPFASQDHAIGAAIQAAHEAGDPAHDIKVLVQDDDNLFRTEWTYGQDPYPPAP